MSDREDIPGLLVVEDSDEDYEATVRSLRKVGPPLEIERCTDGDSVLDRLYLRGDYHGAPRRQPDLILLDLNLPATDGREVLLEIKRDADLSMIPIVVLTTSANPKDIEACYRAGANSYMIKPVNIQEFTQKLQALCRYWFGAVVLPQQEP